MSMEIDSPQLQKPKKHKKTKDKDVEKNEKKCKRHASDDLELALPTNKHESKHRSKSPSAHTRPQWPTKSPVTSPFYQRTSSLYLPLPPISQKYALNGICAEHLSPLILTYYPPLHGVIISYRNARLSTEPNGYARPAYARAIDEYAASFIWLTADFIVFKPQKGSVIEGWVNLQNESNIGLLCLNFFNVTIERKRLAKEWKWIPGGMKPPGRRRQQKATKSVSTKSDEDEESEEEAQENGVDDTQGYFQDAQGKKVEGLIQFRVKNVETSRSMDRETGFLNIEGTMLSEDGERDLQEQEAMRIIGKGKEQYDRSNGPQNAMTGALANGYDGSVDLDDVGDQTTSLKHRRKY